jgi:GrpB-like predicted nucleotidyltransferase (UPF0157 family)
MRGYDYVTSLANQLGIRVKDFNTKYREDDMKRKTVIVPWNEKWLALFSIESSKLIEVFNNEALEIHHVGSTSVPQIGYAKPTIDILVVVSDINKIDLYNSRMELLEYKPKGENGISGRRYFTKGDLQRTHHVHIYEVGNPNAKAHLDFKVYMISHPDEARAYGELKVKLAKMYPEDVRHYQQGKESFVNELMNKANSWAGNRSN